MAIVEVAHAKLRFVHLRRSEHPRVVHQRLINVGIGIDPHVRNSSRVVPQLTRPTVPEKPTGRRVLVPIHAARELSGIDATGLSVNEVRNSAGRLRQREKLEQLS